MGHKITLCILNKWVNEEMCVFNLLLYKLIIAYPCHVKIVAGHCFIQRVVIWGDIWKKKILWNGLMAYCFEIFGEMFHNWSLRENEFTRVDYCGEKKNLKFNQIWEKLGRRWYWEDWNTYNLWNNSQQANRFWTVSTSSHVLPRGSSSSDIHDLSNKWCLKFSFL